ncbi:MAG: endonuclease [Campylobacteraceae bacterium]|nr:endonuclease [Campylobacteraceae bacterium]
MKIILTFFLLTVLAFSKDFTYFLPQDSDKLKNHIEELINTSTKSIDIAMYNFSYKKFAKLLKKAVKRDVQVNVIFDKHKVETDKSSRYKYLSSKGIKSYLSDKKMHLKIALFDNKIAILGSLNWTKASFNENYEIVHITDNENVISKSKIIFKELKKIKD